MYEKQFNSLLDYQRDLVQNCDCIGEADYLIMDTNSYFRRKGYLKRKWPPAFINFVLSKMIIGLSNEDVIINDDAFNPIFAPNISAIIGTNDEESQRNFFKVQNSFSHLVLAQYIPQHNTSYEKFINRPFYIQSAISNIRVKVNSNRSEYLKSCIDFFGEDKVANYGALFHNKNFPNNQLFAKLPTSANFGFSMENSIAKYRITEKLFFTYRNDVIPIYRGDIDNYKIMEEYGINTNSFVDASNMTVAELLLRLDELVHNKTKMYEIYRQPLISNKTFFDQKIKKTYLNVVDFLERKMKNKTFCDQE